MKFNVNDEVRVRLTDHGRWLHRANFDAFVSTLPPRAAATLKYRPPTEDADGWSRWQLWHLMHEFGERMHNGCMVPFETVIDIPGGGDKPSTPEPKAPDAMDAVRAMCR